MDGRMAPRSAAMDTFRLVSGETSLWEWEDKNDSIYCELGSTAD